MKLVLKGKDELQNKLTRFEKKMLTRKIMGQAAGEANTLIVDRTLEGMDKLGDPFADYSESYERIKAKKGGAGFTGEVNLHDKGNMLGNITFKATEKTSHLLFTKPKEQSKALGHIKGVKKNKLPVRDFFGLTKPEEDKVLSFIRDHIKENAEEFNK